MFVVLEGIFTTSLITLELGVFYHQTWTASSTKLVYSCLALWGPSYQWPESRIWNEDDCFSSNRSIIIFSLPCSFALFITPLSTATYCGICSYEGNWNAERSTRRRIPGLNSSYICARSFPWSLHPANHRPSLPTSVYDFNYKELRTSKRP